MNTHQDNSFEKIIGTLPAWVTYEPLQDEIDPRAIPFLKPIFDEKRPIHTVPKSKQADPFAYADHVARAVGSLACGILAPGIRFDASGTRHGRGRGWFDRFLSAIPLEWIRIGVTDISRFSRQNFTRKPWDEPVDWIIIRDGSTWQAIQTNARRGQTNDE
ncbi:hypothetical protein HY622_04245 [Candidatus Uhrbacteria bacterium]|nr:hypothetical protein [Candidatus Uhrbacteria bacterium]